MELTPKELAALRDLLAKADGADVAFVNIADARALTDKGLAARTQEGWSITPEGRAHLSGGDRPISDEPERPEGEVIAFSGGGGGDEPA